MSRLAVGLAAITTLIPSSLAGTYSLVGKTWFPSTAPGHGNDGGYCEWSSTNVYDISYGFKDISSTQRPLAEAPNTVSDSTYKTPTLAGQWKWKLQWVPTSPNDVPPSRVTATVQIKGNARVDVLAYSWGIATATGQASAEIDDTWFAIMQISVVATSTQPFTNVTNFAESPFNGSHVAYTEATFVQVSGQNVWEGEVIFDVASQAPLIANGKASRSTNPKGVVMLGYQANAGARASLGATIRLTHVENQQVQLDL